MRKAFRIVPALLAFAVVLTFAGCSAVQEMVKPADPVFLFTCRAQVQAAGQEITCTFTRSEGEMASIGILSPQEIQGLSYDWTGTGFSVSYAGVTETSAECTLPGDSFAPVLVKAMNAAAREGGLSQGEEGNSYAGSFDGKGFTLTADPQTGNILTLSVPSSGISAEFFYDA